MIALTSLNIPVFDNILQEQRQLNGSAVVDYRLSRFACYLAAMNGDPKKPQVAQAQAYFVQWAEACRLYLEQAEGVERVAIRGEISEHERTLSGTAKSAGVKDYGLFQNSGYRGLYNMDLWQVRRRKGVPDGRSPLDFMDKTELAANWSPGAAGMSAAGMLTRRLASSVTIMVGLSRIGLKLTFAARFRIRRHHFPRCDFALAPPFSLRPLSSLAARRALISA